MVMNSMAKLMVMGSHFDLVSGEHLDEYDIVQIWPDKVYTNKKGFGVFLCEVVDSKEKIGKE